MTEKERAEMRNLRKRVEAQREEIRRLQAEKDENDKMEAERVYLRDCVEKQREEIRRLQAEMADSITVRQLLMTTTEKIVLRDDAGNMDTLEKRGPGRMIVNFDYLPLHVVRVRIGGPFPDAGKPFLLLETEEALP